MTTAQILRAARLRDLLAAIEEWRHASGSDRRYWRGQASWLIGQWRCLHVLPERAAFQQAVARAHAIAYLQHLTTEQLDAMRREANALAAVARGRA